MLPRYTFPLFYITTKIFYTNFTDTVLTKPAPSCLLQLTETQRINATASIYTSRLNASLQQLNEALFNSTDLAVDRSNTSLQTAGFVLGMAGDVTENIDNRLSRLVPLRTGKQCRFSCVVDCCNNILFLSGGVQ